MPTGVYKKTAEHARALSVAMRGKRNSLRHGESSSARRTPEYMAWQNMRARCRNPNNPRYAEYGGRGISVSPGWNDFETFLSDLGRRPGSDYSLDRIDNDGDYEPGNCRWATRSEQQSNQRRRGQL